MDRILNQFVQSKFFVAMIKQYDPLIVFMSGSRAAKIQTNKSDYDICILVNTHKKLDRTYPTDFQQYIHKETGTCLHYVIRELDELFVNVEKGRDVNANSQYLWKAAIEFGLGGEVLYIRDNFKELWKDLDANRSIISKAALYELYTKFWIGRRMLDAAFEYRDLLPSRDIVYALLENYILTNQPISLNRMKEIRAMRPEEVEMLPQEEKVQYAEKIAQIVDIFHNSETFELYKNQANNIYIKINSQEGGKCSITY